MAAPRMSCMEEESLRERLRAALLKQCADLLVASAAHAPLAATASNASAAPGAAGAAPPSPSSPAPRLSRDGFRRAFLDKELLERVFKLFDLDRDGVLRQDDWIEFLKERLTDEKQIDFAEQLESVAFVLCAEDPVTQDKFCQIFRAKGIVDKLFRLIDQDGDGVVTTEKVMEFLANITNARRPSGFEQGNLEWLEKLFRQTVGDGAEIRRDDFRKIVVSKNPFFTERVFQIFDKDNSGSISLQEFIDAMHQFAGQSPDDKIKFLFKVYDLDGDGLIQHRELQHVMRACMEENGMKFSEDQIDDLTMALFEDADPENRGAITFEALKNQLEKHEGLLENLTISIDRWLVPPKPKAPPKSLTRRLAALVPYQLTRPYMKNNYVYLVFLMFVIILNVALFVSRAIEYRNHNTFVIFARACGQCLNFDCMFVLVLMLRHCITFLRTRGFSTILPLDQHIYFHKLVGVLIFIFSVWHTIMHLLNFSLLVVNDPVVNANNYTLTEWILTSRPGLFGLVGGAANPTGVVLIIILFIMFICSQPFVRRGGCFEVFYWTHLLYVPFWVLVIFHAPNFWKWFVAPAIIYIIERILRLVWLRSNRGKTYISSGLVLPSKVIHLVIKRPHHFDFHPGDYVFANIPAIAKYEWHPFTISSAPEQEDYMWLHIRAVGQWTNRLYEYFEREQEKLHSVEEDLTANIVNKKLINGNDLTPAQKFPTSAQRKLDMESSISSKVKAIGYRKDGGGGYINESFTSDNDIGPNRQAQHVSEGDLSLTHPATTNEHLSPTPKKLLQERKLPLLLLARKTPLAKSLSMPDMDNRVKKRQRLMVLREYMRSESEKSFDECQMRRARLQSLGLAYLSPQNKSLAQSFRYMRNKPTIIAFKTPSLENCDAQASAMALSIARQNGSNSAQSPERIAEEGLSRSPVASGSSSQLSSIELALTHTPINYPVGKPLAIYLDGPYGAPSSHIFRAQHAVLIATGIGVTPFASILQSIMHRYWKARHTCPKCKYSWASEIPPTVMKLRKVDFFWINRDQRSFEWFVNLLSQLEIEQAELGGAMERFLDMHMYITSALQKTDMKAVGLQLALDLLHEKEKRDLITGLKTRTNAGRPNWDKVFKQLLDQKKGKITVFYCGPPQLGRILRVKCDQYGFEFRKEVF
ncbi:NADPH oxidase 5 [Schistocerca gregaria]|uniref:NADPH oxidase 5 n=1 Tax=Schistocerca gregaria TaxID=7010 RepID=UPI00211F3114|nr:NADPH oxidase 5 [Schistocerca gregaria]